MQTCRWLCIWPNGDRTVVFDCFSKEEAIEVLDELGPAEEYMLHPMSDGPAFVDFKRIREGRFVEWYANQGDEALNEEVRKKRNRRKPEVPKPISSKAAHIANAFDCSVQLANKIVLENDSEFATGGAVQ